MSEASSSPSGEAAEYTVEYLGGKSYMFRAFNCELLGEMNEPGKVDFIAGSDAEADTVLVEVGKGGSETLLALMQKAIAVKQAKDSGASS
ncbi:MAG: hypothetical protein A2Y38_17145 [Spirochaetes bacterium GWB1_59_5]|nr:MAG: hypothetical protein A2Y38_17145 [Spirochaetes bacterium GWB1_59_5]